MTGISVSAKPSPPIAAVAQHALLVLLLAATPDALRAEAVPAVTSPGPRGVAVTVYRDPKRDPGASFRLAALGGYALVTERRTVDIPAGESELRFEGVAGGIFPETAIVTGLPDGIIEKNRDAWLLSPGSLLDASLGKRVHLRRTSRESGLVRELDAVVRSSADGAVVIESREGIESLRCTGLPETLRYGAVPEGLSAKPTLSVRSRSRTAVRADVTLTYLAAGFDWQANYIAEVDDRRKRMDLFAWLTLANGEETGFVGADAQAVAGHVNRDAESPNAAESPPLRLHCWPAGTTTSDLREVQQQRMRLPSRRIGEEIVVTGSLLRRESAASVTTRMTAVLEELGDLKLYRIPEPVSVAARSQKQVALLRHAGVPIDIVYRRRLQYGPAQVGAQRVILTRNRPQEHLGVPLPGGAVDVFETRRDRRILIGRGQLGDRAVGEEVELETGESTDVQVEIVSVSRSAAETVNRMIATNAKPYPVRFESDVTGTRIDAPASEFRDHDGARIWAVTIPANGRREMTFRFPAR